MDRQARRVGLVVVVGEAYGLKRTSYKVMVRCKSMAETESEIHIPCIKVAVEPEDELLFTSEATEPTAVHLRVMVETVGETGG